MARHLFSGALLCLLASASGFVPRSAPDVDESFGLYAYGDTIGGLQIFYADVGKAFAGDPSNSTSSNAVPIVFERSSDSSSSEWIANPNGTAKASAGWSNEMLYIPSSSSSSHQMGFTAKALSNETTTGFIFYGQWVMVESDSGDISSSFYVQKAGEEQGVYSLLWDASDDDTALPISLRSAAPSNA
ncbi:hypothetical protein N7462_009630 [Penicillium macrosclerotiorum]|uniref:uncharacterized protein n=1 Tax=Penicillium macrosclerotiorum TaxID=303699 RepID=UPI0025483D47|nr:uncharacterized protein N7462_009630 [Penicillium macrosclerotiorum]KAJ5674191.1 hypothetical protein N7462_009630 [Penicillium macrosclerotiorum]